ncbi:Imm61 family immunity protein [Paenarthrobacter sp. NPDC090520]|uniref:Imm61 family immunity protein n=1 Tax=Paenarthrobacter sp. NPDC090520 TaxID=3364382 RepID=UPI0037FA1402
MIDEFDAMIERLHPVVNSARYGITGYEDGVWCISSLGGEIRLYLERKGKWITLTEVERAWHERPVFAATHQDDIQRVLLFRFMNRYRRVQLQSNYLSPTTTPINASKVATGYSLKVGDDGMWQLEKTGSPDTWRGNLTVLVEFSHYAHMDSHDLWEWLYAPEGGIFQEILT